MNSSDSAEERRQAKLADEKAKRDKLDDKVYYWRQQGFTKASIAKMLGFKNSNQLARSFHACEIRKRDEEIDRLIDEVCELKLTIAELQGIPHNNKRKRDTTNITAQEGNNEH